MLLKKRLYLYVLYNMFSKALVSRTQYKDIRFCSDIIESYQDI